MNQTETILIVGTDKGGMIFRSRDRKTWTHSDLMFRGWRVTAACRDHHGTFYVAVAGEVFGATILTSPDLETWTHLESAPRYEEGLPGNAAHNQGLFFLPDQAEAAITEDNPKGLYAFRHVDQIWKLHASHKRVLAGVSEAGLFETRDQGASWQPFEALNHHESQEHWEPGFGGLALHSIISDNHDENRIWIGISSSGVFRTVDGGKTWHRANDGVAPGVDDAYCVHGLCNDPDNADVIFRQEHGGMYRSDDGGVSWQLIENGLPLADLSILNRKNVFGFAIDMDPSSKTTFAFPLTGDDFRYPVDGKMQVYRSQDLGASWHAVNRGLPKEPRYTNVLRGAMATDKQDPCGVYFGSTDGHVFASNNLGATWQEMNITLPKVLCVEAFSVIESL